MDENSSEVEKLKKNLSTAEDEMAATISPEASEVLEKLDPEEQRTIEMMSSYSGPLPPPEYLQGYVDAYPEAAERIFHWVEEQQSHRHLMEKSN